MNRVVMRATYTTETIYNEGFVCVSDNGIEGIFGLDYFRLKPMDNCFELMMSEFTVASKFNRCYVGIRRKHYISQTLYDTQLYCPETYLFFSNNSTDGICLSLTEKVNDNYKIAEVFSDLEMLRKRG